MQWAKRVSSLVRPVVCLRGRLSRTACLENGAVDNVAHVHGSSVSAQCFPLRPRSLSLHRTVSDSLRCRLTRIWAWASAAWSVWMEMDWRRNNYWCDCAHLHSRSPSWPLSAKWNRRGLSNDEANPITWLTCVSLARYLLRKRTLQNQIQKPAGMTAFFGITTMPSRMK